MRSKVGFAIAAGILGVGLAMLPANLLSQESRSDREADRIAQQNQQEPNMAAALEHLRQAEESLERATPNKGGHREKALELTKQAISQTEQGIQYYKEHPNEKRR